MFTAEAEAAQVLMDVYGKLVKADELIAVSSSEVYFRTLRGCAWGSCGCTQPLSWRVTDASFFSP